MGVVGAFRGKGNTDRIIADMIVGAIGIDGAFADDRDALAVVTTESVGTVSIHETLGRRRFAGAVDADSAVGAIGVGGAHFCLAALVDADLCRAALIVGIALGDGLAEVVKAPFTGGAIAIEGALRSRKALAEFTDFTGSTIDVGGAGRRRKRQAGSGDTVHKGAAFGAGLAAVGDGAGIIDALELRKDAVGVGLAEQRGDAGASGAAPGRGAIGGVGALGGHAISGITALSGLAIAVHKAGGSGLAEESVADGTGRTLGVYRAFAIIDASIAEA